MILNKRGTVFPRKTRECGLAFSFLLCGILVASVAPQGVTNCWKVDPTFCPGVAPVPCPPCSTVACSESVTIQAEALPFTSAGQDFRNRMVPANPRVCAFTFRCIEGQFPCSAYQEQCVKNTNADITWAPGPPPTSYGPFAPDPDFYQTCTGSNPGGGGPEQ